MRCFYFANTKKFTDKVTKVVLVDDNEDFCQAVKFLFELENIEVIIYNDASKFLEEHLAEWSGCLLLDLLMPGMDGISLLRELKKRNNKMVPIVISGHTDKVIAAKVKELGANDYLSKPFNVGYLLSKIQSIDQTPLRE